MSKEDLVHRCFVLSHALTLLLVFELLSTFSVPAVSSSALPPAPKTRKSEVEAWQALTSRLNISTREIPLDPCDTEQNSGVELIPGVTVDCWSSPQGYFVKNLYLEGPQVQGQLGDELGNFENLSTLKIANTRLTGPLPKNISNLSTLNLLTIIGNLLLRSPLPNLCTMPDLDQLTLKGSFSGTLDILTCLNSSAIQVIGNLLEGHIPDALGNPETIMMLVLGSNNLSGPIPVGFLTKPNLKHLYLNDNSLSGELPNGFNRSTSLITLDIHNNHIEGKIPVTLANSSNLRKIDLSGNKLSGEIPSIYGMAVDDGLQVELNLSRNFLEGGIPASILSYCSTISQEIVLDLSHNNLSGQVATYTFDSKKIVNFSSNRGLCGTGAMSNLLPLCEAPPLSPVIIFASPPVLPSAHKLSNGVVVSITLAASTVTIIALIFTIRTWRNSPEKIRLLAADVSMIDAQFTYAGTGSDGLIKFTFEEIFEASCGFNYDLLLGSGGFGHVYKGTLKDGREVAIKTLNKSGNHTQGEQEYAAEVEAIGHIHHRHLVSLTGFCSEDENRAIVYEYMQNGNLATHLHGNGKEAITWTRRMKIACGTARGIAYLHEACVPRIIHRDVKPANVLLNDQFEAKVGDFGLAKIMPTGVAAVTTRVLGTWGYVAPEYANMEKVDEKVDVYSYGMVLLELITGKPPFGNSDLLAWVTKLNSTGEILDIADPKLNGDFHVMELQNLLNIAIACLQRNPCLRPSMGQIVRSLEGDMPFKITVS